MSMTIDNETAMGEAIRNMLRHAQKYAEAYQRKRKNFNMYIIIDEEDTYSINTDAERTIALAAMRAADYVGAADCESSYDSGKVLHVDHGILLAGV